jgi:hypothetical protein
VVFLLGMLLMFGGKYIDFSGGGAMVGGAVYTLSIQLLPIA